MSKIRESLRDEHTHAVGRVSPRVLNFNVFVRGGDFEEVEADGDIVDCEQLSPEVCLLVGFDEEVRVL